MMLRALLATALVTWLPAQHAWAHASPVEYAPEASSVTQVEPTYIRIRFSERVDLSASTIIVFGPQGNRLTTGNTRVDPVNPRAFETDVAASGTGTYTVSWQVLSADDGHFTKGAFAFAYGSPSGSIGINQFQVEHKTSLPEALMVWLEVTGFSLLLGMLTWRILLRRLLKDMKTRRMLGICAAGVLSILVADSFYILFKAFDLQTGTHLALGPSIISFLSSVAGRAAVSRMALAVVVLCLTLERKDRASSWRTVLIAITLGVMLLMRVEVSHAAASQFLQTLSIITNFVHLAAKDIWIGACAVLGLSIFPHLARAKNVLGAARAVNLYSILTSVMLAVGGVTGSYIVWLHLKTPENILTTGWGNRFIQLLLMSAVLLALRLYHQLRLDPALARTALGKKKGHDGRRAAFGQVTLLIEASAGIAVLFLSAVMMITTPPDYHGDPYSQTKESQGASITLHNRMQEDAMMAVEIGDNVPVQQVVVTLTNKEKNIGPVVAQIIKRSDHTYVFAKSEMAAQGEWNVEITAQRPSSYDATASFELNSPNDITPVTRVFDLFAIICIVITLALLALAAWLLNNALSLRKQLNKASPKASDFAYIATGKRAAAFIALNIIVLSVLGRYMYPTHFSFFHKACMRNMGVWHESVPMKEGKATTGASFIGCMIGMGQGQFHITDKKEYEMFSQRTFVKASLETAPESLEPNVPATLRFTLKDLQGEAAKDLVAEHDRYLHVIVIGQDFQDFAHIHPNEVTTETLRTGIFDVPYVFPRAGRYLVSAGFTVRGQGFSQEFYVEVGDDSMTPRVPSFATTKTFGDYKVTLTVPPELKIGQQYLFKYDIRKNGEPVTSLQPYLAAAMHVAFVRDDQRIFTHTHGFLPESWFLRLVNTGKPVTRLIHAYLPDSFGPKLDAQLRFVTPGNYVIYAEFKDGDTVVPTMFEVRVR